MAFHWQQKILFKHCDPAGIVFYPRYFEMINDCMEAFFSEALSYPFESFHQTQNGVPTLRIATTFKSPGRHGQMLDFHLAPTRIGTSSLDLVLDVTRDKTPVFSAQVTLVHTLTHTAAPWPEPVRYVLTQMIGDNNAQ